MLIEASIAIVLIVALILIYRRDQKRVSKMTEKERDAQWVDQQW